MSLNGPLRIIQLVAMGTKVLPSIQGGNIQTVSTRILDLTTFDKSESD